MSENKEYLLKIKFLNLIDGGYDFEPVFKGIDSFTLGICKLKFTDNVFHVYTKRPGLLIGKKGETINKLVKIFETPIKIHEVDLLRH